MSEEKIGMYSTEEIYEELANGFLHHSMVDAMYFKIKDLQQKVEQLENIRKEAIEELSYMSTDAYVEDYDIREKHYNLLMNILNKGDNNGRK